MSNKLVVNFPMMHFGIVIGMSLSLLVLLGGFFLLAYSKKEGLGMMSKISSYVAILFGTVVFVGGLICMCICGSCGEKVGWGKDGHYKMEMGLHGGIFCLSWK